MQYKYELILAIGQKIPFYTDEPLTLEQLQGLVGGYIEEIPPVFIKDQFPGYKSAFCNENGKYLNLPRNQLISQPENIDDWIVGDVLLDYNTIDEEEDE